MPSERIYIIWDKKTDLVLLFEWNNPGIILSNLQLVLCTGIKDFGYWFHDTAGEKELGLAFLSSRFICLVIPIKNI